MASNSQAAIRSRLTEITDEVGELAKPTSLNPQQTARLEGLKKEFETLKRELEIAQINEAAAMPGGRLPGDNSDPWERDPMRDPGDVARYRGGDPWSVIRGAGRIDASPAELKARAKSAVAAAGMNDSWRQDVTEMLERFDRDGRIGQQILATTNPHYEQAFSLILRGDKDLLTQEEILAVRRVRDEARAMSLTDGEGGYLLPGWTDPTLTLTGAGSWSEIASISKVVMVPPGADVPRWVTAAQVTSSWDAEGAEVSDDAPTLTNTDVSLYKSAGFIPVSIELEATAENLSSEVGRVLADSYQNLANAAFATGTGSSEPFGVVTAVAGTAGSRVAATTNDAFGLVDVFVTYDALPARHKRNARWLMSPAIGTDIRQLGTSSDYTTWTPLAPANPETLIGAPVSYSTDMDGAIGTGDDDVLLIGDFSNYIIAQRVGFQVERIDHLFGTGSNRPSGQRGFYSWAFLGADSQDDDAFRVLRV